MIGNIRRGDIFLADLGNSVNAVMGGTRPVIIIQNNTANKYAPTVIVAPLMSVRQKRLPTQVELRAVDNDCLIQDSIILLEQIRVIDKSNLKEKITSINYEILGQVEDALGIATGVLGNSIINKALLEMSKPLVVTEGKTDVQLINTAWEKLYPAKEMYFECICSGIEIEEEERQGSAENVRRTLEYHANISDRIVIGLFDNDREGNDQFKGLNKKSFEKYDIQTNIRKHKNKDVYGMLLPVPNERKSFVTEDDASQRYFVIEHYFSDYILRSHSMYGSNILGTCIFKVNNRKDAFSKEVKNLDTKEFENFYILFDKIKEIVNVSHK